MTEHNYYSIAWKDKGIFGDIHRRNGIVSHSIEFNGDKTILKYTRHRPRYYLFGHTVEVHVELIFYNSISGIVTMKYGNEIMKKEDMITK